ncbi:MAG TPA: class I SAM-dependent methyltransferase [Candidatus Polarisedimenticolaceae bacterium]|nr:class I SAM-dependent methyltransferase [Candidatus Polarisedimenticolaceae bacterium]
MSEAILLDAASRYRAAGHAAYWSARSKLTLDPIYGALLSENLDGVTAVTDLGCGRGLALAALLAARSSQVLRLELTGIELAKQPLTIARRALGAAATLVEADLATAPLPASDLFLLLDVLHYLPAEAQDALLDRVRRAMRSGARLLVREADAGAGGRFAAVRFSERLMAVLRGEGSRPLVYRTAGDWKSALENRDLVVEVRPMGSGTPFANVLILARASA